MGTPTPVKSCGPGSPIRRTPPSVRTAQPSSSARRATACISSKDHTRDAAQEAAAGRYWFDIGSGDWDSKGRPSEVRLDRALWVKATDVRREGSILPKATWQLIVDALEEHYRTHGE